MFYINDYNNYINSLSSSQSGGAKGSAVKKTLTGLLTYFFLLIVLTLEIVEPLSDKSARSRLKSNQVASTFFFLFTFLSPLMTFGILWAFDAINKKQSKIWGFIIILTIFNLFQCISTIVALVYSKPELSKTSMGYLYSKISLIFLAIIGLTINILINKSKKES